MSDITLSVVGLSVQEGTVVNVAANLLAALEHRVQVLQADDASGDIVLLDPASEKGRAALGNLDDGQRAILFVDNEAQHNSHPSLVRPVRVQTLSDVLTDLVARLPARSVPRPAVSTAATAKPATAKPATAATTASAVPLPVNLFYLLVDAMLNQSLMSVKCINSDSTVLIHGPTKSVYTRLDGMTLEKMSQQGPDNLQAQKLSESDFMQASRGMSLTRLHDVIWLAERHGSQGIVLPGHSLDVPVRLKVWPKFNSRHVRPEYLKLAALLARQPLTLHALAESSGVALAQVIDFYNASVVFGAIETMASAPVVMPVLKTPTNSGLLGKIARKLALKRD